MRADEDRPLLDPSLPGLCVDARQARRRDTGFRLMRIVGNRWLRIEADWPLVRITR